MDQEIVTAFDQAKSVARDAGERLERRAGGAAAIRAMTIERIGEFIGHRVADRAAMAFSGEDASIRVLRSHHSVSFTRMLKVVRSVIHAFVASLHIRNLRKEANHEHRSHRSFHRRSGGESLFRWSV